MTPKPLANYAVHTIGGGWGQEQFDEKHTVRVAVIRGTDIPKVAIGDVSAVPRRWETPRKVETRLLRPNDIVIEVSGGSPTSGQHTGRALFVTKEMIDQLGGSVIPASFCRLLRLDGSEIDSRYVTYQIAGLHLSGEIGQFENQSTGLANFQFQKFIDSVSPYISEVTEQHRISDVLGCLDARIRHNRALAAKLEAIARRLFKSWFVDFDPVRAKVAGEKPFGLADDIAALFPDRFVDSELGEIPEGWSVTTLGEAFDINPKRTLSKGTMAPYLDMANTPTTGHVPDQIINRAFSSGSKFINGDTLLARITPCLENGKAAFVDFLEDKAVGWGSTEFIVMRPKAKLPEYFGYLLARYEPFKAHAIASMSGTSGRQRVQPDSLATWELVLPSETVAMAFGQIVESMRALIASANEEIRVLRNIRDLLLPRLISGKLRVSEAEEAITEAMV